MKISIKLLLSLSLTLSLLSCGSSKQIAVVTHTARDTLYLNKLQYDSIYIDQWQYIDRTTDTIYKAHVKLEYRYRLLHDTIRIVKVDSIPVIKEVEVFREVSYIPFWIKILSWIGAIFLVILIVNVIVKFYKP